MSTFRIRRIAFVLFIAVQLIRGDGASSQSGSPRLRVFISDLHMGVGRQSDGRWNNFEDFRWSDEFAAFLREVDHVGRGATDLILVGDAFELWQSTADDCIYQEKDFGCTEAEAIGRMRRVVANHRDELAALGAFAKNGTNRVVLVPGNHDAALLFDGVAEIVVNTIGAGSAVEVSRSGAWISPDGAIYAEHGHEIGKEVNRFDGWPRPFLGNPPHLRRPWGEQFVQQYYNRFESKYPIIDNILSEGVGVHYAVKAEGVAETAADIGRFVSFFVTKLSWAQFNGVLGAPDNAAPPEWNFDAIRRQGDQFFVDSLPPNDPFRSAAEQALKGGLLGLSMRDLTDDDIRAICDARAALNEAQLRVQLVSPPSPCPVKTLGAMSQSLLRSRDAILREHLQARSDGLSQVQPNAQKFQLFIFGHTHEAQSPFEPMSGLSTWQPIVINTGAWQRVISPEALERWRGARPASAVLSELPEALPPCYSVVVVEPYQISPNASLRYWTNRDGRWQFADSCRWTPPAE